MDSAKSIKSDKIEYFKFMELRIESLDKKIGQDFKIKRVKKTTGKAFVDTLTISDISVSTIQIDDENGPKNDEWLNEDAGIEEKRGG